MQYKVGEMVWVGDKEFRVKGYDEHMRWDPFFSRDTAPGYRLTEVTREYFENPTVHSARPEEVHHMPLRLRVLRLETALGLDKD